MKDKIQSAITSGVMIEAWYWSTTKNRHVPMKFSPLGFHEDKLIALMGKHLEPRLYPLKRFQRVMVLAVPANTLDPGEFEAFTATLQTKASYFEAQQQVDYDNLQQRQLDEYHENLLQQFDDNCEARQQSVQGELTENEQDRLLWNRPAREPRVSVIKKPLEKEQSEIDRSGPPSELELEIEAILTSVRTDDTDDLS